MSLIRNPKDWRLVIPLLVAEEGAPCPNGADVVKAIQNFMDDNRLNHFADPEFNMLTDALAPKEELTLQQRLQQLKETRAAEASKETGEEEKFDTTVKVKEEFGALPQFPMSSGKRFKDPLASLETGKEVAETSEQHHLRMFVFDYLCKTVVHHKLLIPQTRGDVCALLQQVSKLAIGDSPRTALEALSTMASIKTSSKMPFAEINKLFTKLHKSLTKCELTLSQLSLHALLMAMEGDQHFELRLQQLREMLARGELNWDKAMAHLTHQSLIKRHVAPPPPPKPKT